MVTDLPDHPDSLGRPVEMNVVLWHRQTKSPGEQERALASARLFQGELEPRLPFPYKDKEEQTIGRIVRVWVVEAAMAVMVVARVELGAS